jgi:hypothetical protein
MEKDVSGIILGLLTLIIIVMFTLDNGVIFAFLSGAAALIILGLMFIVLGTMILVKHGNIIFIGYVILLGLVSILIYIILYIIPFLQRNTNPMITNTAFIIGFIYIAMVAFYN